jgi:hypothetical protein
MKLTSGIGQSHDMGKVKAAFPGRSQGNAQQFGITRFIFHQQDAYQRR